MLSEVSKRGWRGGVDDKQTPKNNQKGSPVTLLLRGGIGKRVQKRGLNLWHDKDFFATTPSVRQPLFEPSDVGELSAHGHPSEKRLIRLTF